MNAAQTDRVSIYLYDGSLPGIVDEIEAALIQRDPSIVQQNGSLHIDTADGFVKATAHRLRIHTMRIADFYKIAPPPQYTVAIDPALKYFEALRQKGAVAISSSRY